MTLEHLTQHPDRVALANELHARPFPMVKAPSRAACIAIERDPKSDADRAALTALLDRYGAPHPAPDANHMSAQLGSARLRWERHTEFVTYTLYGEGSADVPFSGELFSSFPADWLKASPGRVLTSALVRVEEAVSEEAAIDRLRTVRGQWFVEESLAAAFVVDRTTAIAGDFRMDPAGHMRFAIFVIGDTGPQRVGRILQRVIEIETYKSMAMLTLPIARNSFGTLDALDQDMSVVVNDLAGEAGDNRHALDRLLSISARVEGFSADTAYRLTAAEAYGALVHQRIEVLREERMGGFQTFSEFMMRRFEPAMRTCRAAARRLADTSGRAARASRLLSTRVTVETNEQNRDLLRQMDRRAALQLRLQETVEGLSVVAISYYAVNLLAKLLLPVASGFGVTEKWVYAGLVIPVVVLVALLTRRVRRMVENGGD